MQCEGRMTECAREKMEKREKAITDKTAIGKSRERERECERESERERERANERERDRVSRERGGRGRESDPHPPPMHYSVHIYPQILISLAPALSFPTLFPTISSLHLPLSIYIHFQYSESPETPLALYFLLSHALKKDKESPRRSTNICLLVSFSPFFAHLDFLRPS